jgi:hypothetical protein
MSNARIEECRACYRQVAGCNVFKKRTVLHPSGWKEIVTRCEHSTLWPLNIMMHDSQIVRFMLLEQTYAFSAKWLDATGNNAVDQVASASYARILNMLRWEIRTVYVNDVQQVMTRGRKQVGQQQQDMFDERDMRFDNMTLAKVKQLARVAMYDWEAAKHQMSSMDDEEHVFQQLLDFDMDELDARAQQLAAEGAHPAEMFDAQDMEGLEFDGAVMNEEEQEIVFGREQSDDGEGDAHVAC